MSEFIYHIDEANHRLNELEAELGIPRSEFNGNCDGVNAGIASLENKVAAKAPKQAAPSKQQAPPVVQQVAPPKLAVKPLPNDLAAMKLSGRATGLGKAMIAAEERARA